MPKIVDHEQRRHDLAEALWRIVAKSGTSAVSIRTVAAEAGWSAGALRHYFQTRGELLEFAIERAEERVTHRITARSPIDSANGPIVDQMAEVIEELLPLDAQRQSEFQIWRTIGEEFTTEAHDEGDQRRWAMQRELYRSLVAALGGDEQPSERVAAQAEYLHVFCDGLAADLMYAPARMPPENARRLLRRFLADVAGVNENTAPQP